MFRRGDILTQGSMTIARPVSPPDIAGLKRSLA